MNAPLTSLSQFKAFPLEELKKAKEQDPFAPLVVLKHNKPAFYVLTPEMYAYLGKK